LRLQRRASTLQFFEYTPYTLARPQSDHKATTKDALNTPAGGASTAAPGTRVLPGAAGALACAPRIHYDRQLRKFLDATDL